MTSFVQFTFSFNSSTNFCFYRFSISWSYCVDIARFAIMRVLSDSARHRVVVHCLGHSRIMHVLHEDRITHRHTTALRVESIQRKYFARPYCMSGLMLVARETTVVWGPLGTVGFHRGPIWHQWSPIGGPLGPVGSNGIQTEFLCGPMDTNGVPLDPCGLEV